MYRGPKRSKNRSRNTSTAKTNVPQPIQTRSITSNLSVLTSQRYTPTPTTHQSIRRAVAGINTSRPPSTTTVQSRNVTKSSLSHQPSSPIHINTSASPISPNPQTHSGRAFRSSVEQQQHQQQQSQQSPHSRAERPFSIQLKSPSVSFRRSFPSLPKKVKIVEVSPRDGLQNINQILDVETKVQLINLLNKTGLSVIEAGSFVSPKWVPQMADSNRVFEQINKLPTITYPVLTPNMVGFEKAMEVGAKEVSVFAAASEAFSLKNINCTIQESLDRFKPVLEAAKQHNVRVRGYVSCVLGCPYQGEVPVTEVARVAKWLYDHGCYEISLGDTIGVGNAISTYEMICEVTQYVPVDALAVHMHDTHGQALANILVALQMGVKTVDSSVGGLGGCPYARGASGNVATEDVLYMLNGMGIETNVDMDRILDATRYITGQLQIKPSSKASTALMNNRKKYADNPLSSEPHQKLLAMTIMPH